MIRDRQTGDSLQYAFIEFADRKSCEEAYFKMDNVLIDDRRIHVDFSQSVAKMRWKGKGKGIQYFDDKGNDASRENREKVTTLQHKKRDESRGKGSVIKNRREHDRRYREEAVEHRKHKRRKESGKDDSGDSKNEERYVERGKHKKERHRDRSREKYKHSNHKSRHHRDRSTERHEKSGKCREKRR